MLKTAEERQEDERVTPNRECRFVAPHPPTPPAKSKSKKKKTDSADTMI